MPALAQMRSRMVCLTGDNVFRVLASSSKNKRRDEKYRFDDDEVFNGLLLALLANGIDWAVVARAFMSVRQLQHWGIRAQNRLFSTIAA
jgi:hypothetical protein